jgi:hypothetical protein
MDVEVTALEGKLSKAREVKAGDDVRVVDGEGEVNVRMWKEVVQFLDGI